MCKPGATIDNRFPLALYGVLAGLLRNKTSHGKNKKDFSSAAQDVTDAHESTYALTDSRRERHARNEVRTAPGGAKPAASAQRDAVAATALRRIRE